jgi:uncharacterized surface protein with fasciclin (FAS1) repeats
VNPQLYKWIVGTPFIGLETSEQKHRNPQRIQGAEVFMSYQEQTIVSQGADVDESLLTRSIFETLTRDESLVTFTMALERGRFRALLEAPELVTVFAIPENVLDRMVPSLRDAIVENRTADVRRWAGRHVAKGKQLEADLRLVTHVTTIEGEALTVSHNDAQVQVNGFRIVKSDIACTNGVIHIVDWIAGR